MRTSGRLCVTKICEPPIHKALSPNQERGGVNPLRWILEKGVVGRGDTPPVGVRFFGWVGLYIIGC